MLPEPIKKFIRIFSSLPSIGPRQAHRLAFHIRSLPENEVQELSKTVMSLTDVNLCRQCFFTYEKKAEDKQGLCAICADAGRQKNVVAIVEKETSLISLEKTKRFPGRYLVLGDLPKDGYLSDEQKRRLDTLKANAKTNGPFAEIIIALSPTTFGDVNASVIADYLKGSTKKITRLGRGIPTGGEIEFADEETLVGALDSRS